MSDELYRGVATANPPSHAKLKPDWVRPEPPLGFSNLVAILAEVRVDNRKAFEWFLDYLDTDRNVFASDETDVCVPWPWENGFVPQAHDWDAIGIPHLM